MFRNTRPKVRDPDHEIDRILNRPDPQTVNDSDRQDMRKRLQKPGCGMPLKDMQVDALVKFERSAGLIGALSVGCHRKGQGIITSSGVIKKVEDIIEGDFLLGLGGGCRRVLKLCRGIGPMFRVIPTKGDSFVVNEDHVLTIFQTPRVKGEQGYLEDIAVRDWLALPPHKQRNTKLYRNPDQVTFHSKHVDLTVPPYLLGVLLGDGHLDHQVTITTAEPEIVSYCKTIAPQLNCSIRTTHRNGCHGLHFRGISKQEKNDLVKNLIGLGLYPSGADSKQIPQHYLYATVENRKELLAGLLDTDGYVNRGCFDFISKSSQLAEGVAFLARSLGLAAYLKKSKKSWIYGGVKNWGWYYRVMISGDTHIIPCKVPRKKATRRRQIKRTFVTGFKIVPLNVVEDYYGFTLDGDGRYFLDDFTLTHNSGKTLLSYCLPFIAESERTLYLVPAKLIKELKREFSLYRQHYLHHSCEVVILSYTKVSRNPCLIDKYRPDLIVADEAHKLSNVRRDGAKVAKAVQSYMRRYASTCCFVALSGTLIKRELLDMSHLFAWALEEESPLPIKRSDAWQWGLAIDPIPPGSPRQRMSAGELKKLSSTWTQDTNQYGQLGAVREAVANQIRRTEGFIASNSPYSGPIEFQEISFKTKLPKSFEELGQAGPVEASSGLHLHRMRVQANLGFVYGVEDDEVHVINPDRFREALDAIRPYATEGTIIWCPWKRVLRTISDILCVKSAPPKTDIHAHKGSCVVASFLGFYEGYNLQHHWHRQIFLVPPDTGRQFEQAIGRCYRMGQTNKVEIFMLECPRFKRTIQKLQTDAKITQTLLQQKFTFLDKKLDIE